MLSITDKAKEKLKEISDGEGIGHYSVRIKLIGGGCAGFQTDMHFEHDILDTDNVFEFEDIKIIIDELSYQYLDEIEIDWEDRLIGGGFKFINPKSTGSCGCGKSLSF